MKRKSKPVTKPIPAMKVQHGQFAYTPPGDAGVSIQLDKRRKVFVAKTADNDFTIQFTKSNGGDDDAIRTGLMIGKEAAQALVTLLGYYGIEMPKVLACTMTIPSVVWEPKKINPKKKAKK